MSVLLLSQKMLCEHLKGDTCVCTYMFAFMRAINERGVGVGERERVCVCDEKTERLKVYTNERESVYTYKRDRQTQRVYVHETTTGEFSVCMYAC